MSEEYEQFFDHLKHDIDEEDHSLLDTMERHALCRRRCKGCSQMIFTIAPIPLLFSTMSVMMSDFDSGGPDIGKHYTYDYVLGVVITSVITIIFIFIHHYLQVIDNHIINAYHAMPGDANNHIVGYDDIMSYLVFLAGFVNSTRGFVLSRDVEQIDLDRGLGIPFATFRTFVIETFLIQLFVLFMGWSHIYSTATHTFNMQVKNFGFNGSDTTSTTVDGKRNGCRPGWGWGCWGGPRTCSFSISHVCETGELCFVPCCCKTIYRTERSGRRALKQDLDQLVQLKDLMTRQPGWRTNVGLKIKIKKLSQKCKRMKNEIHKRYCLQSTQKMDGTQRVAVVMSPRCADFDV